MLITKEILKKCYPNIKYADIYCPILTEAFETYDMKTIDRQAMFLAQCLHESMGFFYSHEVWGPTKWQIAYEGHKGLGNVTPGDGKLFMGRGAIQLTGRANYQAFADWVGDQSIMTNPKMVEGSKYYILSAIWFWKKNNLNRFADANDIVGCTKKVNGPKMLGLKERTQYYEALKNELAKD